MLVPDAICAAGLCHGGAVYYHVKDEAQLSDDWICEHVSPNITKTFGKQVGTVLGRALLWRIMHPIEHRVLPKTQVDHVRALYGMRTNDLDEDENPVCKVALQVLRYACDGQLNFIPSLPDAEPDSDDDDDGSEDTEFVDAARRERRRKRQNNRYEADVNTQMLRSNGMNDEKLTVLSARVLHVDRRIAAHEENTNRAFSCMMGMLRTINDNVRKVGTQPYRVVPRARTGNAATIEAESELDRSTGSSIRENAKLHANIHCLHVLWNEYVSGIGLNIPAKDFTKKESNVLTIKYTYSRRKVFWLFVKTMISRGYDAKAAIDLILKAYHPICKPTPIINLLREGTKKNTLPSILKLDPRAR